VAANLLLKVGPRRHFAAVSLIGQLGIATVYLGVSIMTARLLGPAGRGEFTAWTLSTLAGTVLLTGSLAVGAGRTYLSGEAAKIGPSAIRHGVLAALIVAPATAIALIAGVPPLPLLCCIAVSVPISVTTADVLIAMQAAKRPWIFYSAQVGAGIPLLLGLAVIALAVTTDQRTILDVAYALWAVGIVMAGIGALWIARRTFGHSPPGSVRTLRRRGAGAYGGMIGDFIVTRADRYVTLAIVGTSGLGIFSVAASWAAIGLYAGHAIGQASFEDESTLDQATARRILIRGGSLVAVIAATNIGAAFLLIEPIFGPAFGQASWVVLLLGPGVIARTVAFITGQILLARGEGSRVTRIMAGTVAFAIPGWIVGAELAGIEGVALVSSLAYGLQMILSLRTLNRRRTLTSTITAE
jgi:enterobacterial common antigen flippase